MKKTFFNTGLPNLLIHLWHHLGRRRQLQLGFLMGLMLISAFAEVVSLGAVIPFLGILVAPDQLFDYSIVKGFTKTWGINSPDQLVFPLTVAFAGAALIAGSIRILLLWASTRLAVSSGVDLSSEVYRRTLYQPYWVHASRNSSEVISGITIKVVTAVNVIYQMLILISSITLLVSITLALIVIDPMVASITAIAFGISYFLITWISRRKLNSNSQRIAYEQTQVVKALQEGLGGIRDVLLDGTQSVYCDIYRKADLPLRRAHGNNSFIAGSPRFIMEAIGIVLIASLAYVLSLKDGGISSALPVLGAMALGAQRMLPALQQSFNAWASIAGSNASLADIVSLLNQPLPAELKHSAQTPFLIQKDICFNNVRFRYDTDGPWVLDGLSLVIPKGARVGFVGSTGSGKTTALDLLMGLLVPTEGEILIDGQTTRGNRLRAWQKNIAHVPQSIYLADTSLAENIAFGVSPNKIDMKLVRESARRAQISDFIESNPEGYQSNVGERGIRLSGGQRQRIGIARALYKQANVLVFDEATSSLDSATEKSVMKSIEGLASNFTILLIAHRLTTVQNCDIIVELKNGRVAAKGTYEQLLESSSSFRKMASIR